MYPQCHSSIPITKQNILVLQMTMCFELGILPEKIQTFFSRAAKSENEIENVQGFTHCPSHRIFLLDLFDFLT